MVVRVLVQVNVVGFKSRNIPLSAFVTTAARGPGVYVESDGDD